MVHDLKISPEYFDDVESGIKTFEIRRDDRNYSKGDILNLREWDGDYTGREMRKIVSYVLRDRRYCRNAYCVLGLVQERGQDWPTDKQIEFANDISERVGEPLPSEFTKQAYSQFISKNIGVYELYGYDNYVYQKVDFR